MRNLCPATALFLLATILAGCGPFAVGAGLNELLKDDTAPDKVIPNVEFVSPDGSETLVAASFEAGIPFRIKLNKEGMTLFGKLVGPEDDPIPLDLDGCPIDPSQLDELVLDQGLTGLPDPPLQAQVDGIHRFVALVRDGQGRVSCRSHAWVVDLQPPDVPKLRALDAIGPGSVRLRWDRSLDEGLGVREYRIQLEARASFADAGAPLDPVVVPAGAGEEPSYEHVVTGLRAGTIYRAIVTAVDRAGGESEPSEEFGTRTLEGADGTFGIAAAVDLGAPVVGLAILDEGGASTIVAVLDDAGSATVVALRFDAGTGEYVEQQPRRTVALEPRGVSVVTLGEPGSARRYVVVFGSDGAAGKVAVLEPMLDESQPVNGRVSFEERQSIAADYPVTSVDAADWSADEIPDLALALQADEQGTAFLGRVEIVAGTSGGLLDGSVPRALRCDRPHDVFNGARHLAAIAIAGDQRPCLFFADDATVRMYPAAAVCEDGGWPFQFPRIVAAAPDVAGLGADHLALRDDGGPEEDPELVVALRDGRLRVYPNTYGSLSDPATISIGERLGDLTFGDFNDDGLQDVAVCDVLGKRVVVLAGNGEGELTTQVPSDAGGSIDLLAAGQLDDDEFLDLVVAERGNGTVRVLRAQGGTVASTGGFAFADRIRTLGGGAKPSVLDLDGDGAPDLFMGHSTAASNGTPIDAISTIGGPVLDAGGIARASTKPTVSATPAVGASETRVTDFDGNGSPDIVVGGSEGVAVAFGSAVEGLPVGTFQSSGELIREAIGDFLDQFMPEDERTCRGLAVADFGADATDDLAVACFFEDGAPGWGAIVWIFGDITTRSSGELDAGSLEFAGAVAFAFLRDVSGGRTRVDLVPGLVDAGTVQDLIVADPAASELFLILDDLNQPPQVGGQRVATNEGTARNFVKTQLDLPGVRPIAPQLVKIGAERKDIVLLDRDASRVIVLLRGIWDGGEPATGAVEVDDVLEDVVRDEFGNVTGARNVVSEVRVDGVALQGEYLASGWIPSRVQESMQVPEGYINDTMLLYTRVTVDDLPSPGRFVEVADLDDDGDLDLAVLMANNEVAIIRQSAPDEFEYEGSYRAGSASDPVRTATGIVALDANGDGVMDLVVSDAGDGSTSGDDGAGFRVVLGDSSASR